MVVRSTAQPIRTPLGPDFEAAQKCLLTHDVSKRPTSQELLQSDLVPPPVLEECQLQELVRHTLSNPHLKAYKYLVASCFNQPISYAQDIIYDRDPSIPNAYKHLKVYDFVRKSIIKIFKLHGGQNLPTPLLMPKSKFYENVDSYVRLMTHSGNIVSIPHDLRVPFARYLAWNGITLLRRFSIERVFREKKVFGYIPRELYECAFDIVAPSPGNFMSDAELFYILKEIVDSLPGLHDKTFLIRMNHTSLIRAILLHCGIKEKHCEIYNILSDAREGKVTKFQIRTHLISLGLSDSTILMLFNLLESESPINKISSQLQMITKKKSTEASTLAKQALQELKLIIQNVESFEVDVSI
ncbi:hypothetical protein QE152_g37698 [Popillia japonica]|uniref:Uncharacterized protein n=1 Tax=Popillia japonica TaxID=7064 RepID=A0AAW1I9C9_POPJA